MIRRISFIIALLATLSVSVANAQYATQVTQSNVLNASGASTQTSANTTGLNVGVYKLNWVVTATVSACTAIVEAGSDNITFGTTESTSTCTSSGEVTVFDNTPRNFVRVRFSALTVSGGGSVKYVISLPVDSLNSGNLFAGAANSQGTTAIVPGKQTFWFDTGTPIAATGGTSTAGIANQFWYTQVRIPENMTITNVNILCGGTCTTDKMVAAIYTTAGVLLANSTVTGSGTAVSGANTYQVLALTTPLVVQGPTKLIVGVQTSATTAGQIQTMVNVGPVCALSAGLASNVPASPLATVVTTSTAATCPIGFVN